VHLTTRQTQAITLVFRVLMTIVIVCAALLMAYYVWTYYEIAPRTRDGHVLADVVDVTTDVSGLLTEVDVHGNQFVEKGQVLFRVDPLRFSIALDKAKASLDSAQAALMFARQQNSRNHALQGLVAQQSVDQTDNNLRSAQATLEQAKATLASAQLDLERATVRAPFAGIATNVTLHPGRYVAAGTGMLALVDQASLRVEGYFQETRLSHIHIGDRARVDLMGESVPLYGHVVSISGGITDSETTAGANLLPTINPNFAWVRLAQRVPVWVALDETPTRQLLLSGRSATVSIIGELGHAEAAVPGSAAVGAQTVSSPTETLPGAKP